MTKVRLLVVFAMLWTACEKPQPAAQRDVMFESLGSSQTGIDFVNQVDNTDELNIFNYRNFYNGGGVAIGDLNGDGLNDIYLTANMGSNKLYLNEGDFRFRDATEEAGVGLADKWSTGVVFADINADGQTDIYVCNAGYVAGQDQQNSLFLNQGDGSFREAGAEFGLADAGYTTHAAFLDYDQDGDLDVYMLNNSFIPVNTLNYSNKRELPAEEWPVRDFLKGGGDRFLRNDNGRFVDVSQEVGIYQSLIGFGLGVTVGDVNQDSWPDLYISNDFFEKDYFYLNQQDGTFKECAEDYFQHISHSSMGADLRDVNNDGQVDLFVTDMLPRDDYRLKTNASFDDINLRRLKVDKGFYHQYMHNTLQLNRGEAFKEISFHADVAGSDWSWGALMFDADNDRNTDIFVCNGIYRDVIDLDFMDFFANDVMQEMALSGEKEEMTKVIERIPSNPIQNLAFRNLGDLSFAEVNAEWGLDQETFSNGSAYGDLDNDGDLDLVVNNVNQQALIYRNSTEGNSLRIKLEGTASNPDAIGAAVSVFSGGEVLYQEVNPSRGFQSSVPTELLFGLGDSGVDSIRVIWPDGSRSVHMLESSGARQKMSISKSSAKTGAMAKHSAGYQLDANSFKAHREDDYVDYYYERGIYRMLSREGPASAVGDVNGDGLDDVFMGAAVNDVAQLYVQTPGGFAEMPQQAFARHYFFEDVAAEFFDADGDGDLDLMVGSGGNHVSPNSPELNDRLYRNDGKGNFSHDPAFRPQIGMNTSVIRPADFDGDGDLDVFIGSRSVPQRYAFSPVHFFFENDGQGGFTEVSEKWFGQFKGVGMVTDAIWTNLHGDELPELVLVGDWDYPRIFHKSGESFKQLENNLGSLNGWFYSVASADFNGDGREDLVLGNHGTNSYVRPDEDQPVKLWIKDFDGNGYIDRVITQTKEDKDYPLLLKRELADQIVSIKKAGTTHSEYAGLAIDELLPAGSMDGAGSRLFNSAVSVIALSKEDASFELIPLPSEAQLSSIKAIHVEDLDADGDQDLVIGGNDYHLLPQFSRLDASFGTKLFNNGDGEMSYQEGQSDLWVRGEIKAIHALSDGRLLAIRNSDTPVLITLNSEAQQ